MEQEQFGGRIVVVSGASSGIGAAVARGFAAANSRVGLLARRSERLEALRNELGTSRVLVLPTDVRDYAAVNSAAQVVLQMWSRVDILVNCAGVYPPEVPLWETSPTDWDETIETNLTGVFYCIRAFLPSMLQNGYGRIINVSSNMTRTPSAAAYSISKAGVDRITRILALELAEVDADVTVSCFHPGFVKTEMNPEGTRDPSEVVHKVFQMAALTGKAESGRKW